MISEARLASRTPAPRAGATSTVVAIDLGALSVRVVEMELTSDGGGRVGRKGMASLPPRVWDDLTSNREVVAAAIRQAMSGAGIAARSVVACLPRRLVTLRFARLPNAPPEQLRGMVAFEAQQYIPLALDDVILDYHVISLPLAGLMGSDDDMQTVLLAAARRSLVADLMAIFDKAGLELLRLSVSALALAELSRDALEPTGIIDLEPGEMDVAVVSEGRLLFTRATILDIENIAPEVAQRRLAEEVSRSFTSYQNEFRHKPLAHVYLAGASTAGMENVERGLTELLEMPVTRLPHRLLADADTRGYATAIGLAFQTRPGSLAPINLVPNERAERKAATARLRQKQAGALAVLGLAALGAFVVQKTLASRAETDKMTRSANAELTQAKTLTAAAKTSHDRVLSQYTDLTKSLDRNHPTTDILVAISHAMPRTDTIWLTQYAFDRGGLLTLRGETKTPMAATDLVIALQKSGAFSKVQLGYLGDAQETDSSGGNGTTNGSGGSANPPAKINTPAATQKMTPLPGMANPGGNPAAAPNGPRPGMTMPPGMTVPPGVPMPGQMPPGGPPSGPGGPISNGPTLTGANTMPGAKPRMAGGVVKATTGAAINNVTTTPAVSSSGKKTASKAAKPAPPRTPLASFIITCRLSDKGGPLVPAGLVAPAEVKPSHTASHPDGATSGAANPSTPDADTGDDNANP